MLFSARSPRIRHRNELTESDWENVVQGPGKKKRYHVCKGRERGRRLDKRQLKHMRALSKGAVKWGTYTEIRVFFDSHGPSHCRRITGETVVNL